MPDSVYSGRYLESLLPFATCASLEFFGGFPNMREPTRALHCMIPALETWFPKSFVHSLGDLDKLKTGMSE